MDRRKEKTGFTLMELLVVIATIVLMMAILLPALNKARRQTRRTVCFSNIKQLMTAWLAYADSYDGRIVNGGQSPENTPVPKEIYWCTPAKSADGKFDWDVDKLSLEQRIEKLKEGALYRYLNEVKIYRCPEAEKDMHRTYSIVNSMNGSWVGGADRKEVGEGEIIKNLNQLKRTQERIVFMEEGYPSPDSFIVPYKTSSWWDIPQCPHEGRCNFGFADGHVETWEWEDNRTLQFCLMGWSKISSGYYPQPGNKDIQKVQIGTWGELGH